MRGKNIGNWDKGLRLFIVAAAAIPIFSRTARDGLTWILIISIVYLLITALSGRCLIYDLFNFSTRDDHETGGK